MEKNDIFLVPGNHDVGESNSAHNAYIASILQRINENPDDYADFMSKDADIRTTFKEYNEFVERMTHCYKELFQNSVKVFIFLIYIHDNRDHKMSSELFGLFHMTAFIYINTVENQGTGLSKQSLGKHSTSENNECYTPLSDMTRTAICFD